MIAQQKGEFNEALQCQDTFLELIGEVKALCTLHDAMLAISGVAEDSCVTSAHINMAQLLSSRVAVNCFCKTLAVVPIGIGDHPPA